MDYVLTGVLLLVLIAQTVDQVRQSGDRSKVIRQTLMGVVIGACLYLTLDDQPWLVASLIAAAMTELLVRRSAQS